MSIIIAEPVKKVQVALRALKPGEVVDDTDFREESRGPQYETVVDIKREVLDTHGEICKMIPAHLSVALEQITGMNWIASLALAKSLWPLLERGEKVVLMSHKHINGPLSMLCEFVP